MRSSQLGRALENLAENAWTAGSDGRLVTYLPVLDSRGVDRAVAVAGGPPLFVQVKGHERTRPGGRLAFAIPVAEVGTYDRWVALLLHAAPDRLHQAYVIPARDLANRGERGHTVDGRECLHVTLSPTSPTWRDFAVPPARLGDRLAQLAGPPERPELAAPELLERSQEEGAYFEEATVAAIYGGTDRLAVYRPAVDVGRDLLVQLAGTASHAYLQVKGTERQDRPGLARFQVRCRAYASDPALHYLFCYREPGAVLPRTAWLVPSAELAQDAASGDPDHISFEAHIDRPDARWGAYRLDVAELAARVEAIVTPG